MTGSFMGTHVVAHARASRPGGCLQVFAAMRLLMHTWTVTADTALLLALGECCAPSMCDLSGT